MTQPTEPEPTPLTPPDPPGTHEPVDGPEHAADEADEVPFSDGPPPLPEPMLVLDGSVPDDPVEEDPEPAEDHGTCACGGAFDPDGWCTTCGQARPDPRDHQQIDAGPRLAAVSDRGRRHRTNEDAAAVRVDATDPARLLLVACDGVSSATRAQEGSAAAALAAVDALEDVRGPGEEVLTRAADAAATAVAEVARAHPGSTPSCTMVLGVAEGRQVTVGNVGDSRAYWIPETGEAVRLTSDDSMAEEQVRQGIAREVAESSHLAHTITRWLGPDAPDHTPHVTTLEVEEPGWLLLCTDGLWNYASEPAALAEVVRARVDGEGTTPLALARDLVAWANEQGGSDNITVALARLGVEDGPSNGQDGTHG